MQNTDNKYRIVYCTPALYMAGGVERVLTLKANYFAEQLGYDITIILTEGKGKKLFYDLSDKVKIINLDINFEELWHCSFVKKIFVYLKKQREYKKKLTAELMRLRPDITISLLRREINFINEIKDGSKKIGELHINRANYRNFEDNDTNIIKRIFAYFWMKNLLVHLKKLDKFIVLTHEDKNAWHELNNIEVIPDPLSFIPKSISNLSNKLVIAVGRYVYQKGFDLLLEAWAKVSTKCPEWSLAIYGDGNRQPYQELADKLNIDSKRCLLNPRTLDIEQEYLNSSLFVLSSRFEGFGMVLVEAMACGLPVVSFDCPCGPKDIIMDNFNGLIVPSNDKETLANTIILLINDRNKMVHMSKQAKKRSNDYELSIISKLWKDLFDGICKKNQNNVEVII